MPCGVVEAHATAWAASSEMGRAQTPPSVDQPALGPAVTKDAYALTDGEDARQGVYAVGVAWRQLPSACFGRRPL